MKIRRYLERLGTRLFLHMIGREGQQIWNRLKEVNSTNLNLKKYATAGKHCD